MTEGSEAMVVAQLTALYVALRDVWSTIRYYIKKRKGVA